MGDVLPAFSSHEGNIKTRPIDDGPREPSEVVRAFVRSAGTGRRPRILDVGCGRGDTVAWLCERGFDAYGVDVDESYLVHGRAYLSDHGFGDDRLRPVVAGSYPFEDGAFDLVLSDQVLEHVADLESFASEVSRVSGRGARGQHVFPARWRPVEVHMGTPFVHWLPKGKARRAALSVALRAGMAASYFEDLAIDDRVEVFAAYSEDQTFYRPLAQVTASFSRHGLAPDVVGPSRRRVASRAPSVPAVAVPLAGWLYRNAFSVCLETH